jgi:hypothetical protein
MGPARAAMREAGLYGFFEGVWQRMEYARQWVSGPASRVVMPLGSATTTTPEAPRGRFASNTTPGSREQRAAKYAEVNMSMSAMFDSALRDQDS